MRKKIVLAAFMGIAVLLWVMIAQPEEKFEQTFSEIAEVMSFVFLDDLRQHQVKKPDVESHRSRHGQSNHSEMLNKATLGNFDEQIQISYRELHMHGRMPDLNRQNAIKWYLRVVQNPKLKSQKGLDSNLRKLEITLFEAIVTEKGLSPIPILVRDQTGQVKGYRHKLENHAESLFFRAGSHYSLHARAMHSYLFTQRYNLGNKDMVAREYAIKWLHNIAEMGSRGHQLRLAALYKQGVFVQKDLEKAELWRARAIANKSPGFFDAGVAMIDRYAK